MTTTSFSEMSPRRAARFAASVAVFGLVAASCGAGSDSSAPAATDPAPPVTETETEADPSADPGVTDSVEAAPEPDTPDTETPGTETPGTEPQATEPPATEAPAPEPAPAPEILQFTAPLVGGGEIDAATLGGKATVFWFWAPT